jgi:hypothetical protein
MTTTFTQTSQPCDEHDTCTLTVCVADDDLVDEDGELIHPAAAIVWESHGLVGVESV